MNRRQALWGHRSFVFNEHLNADGSVDQTKVQSTVTIDCTGSGQVAVISDLQAGSLEALIRDWLHAFGSDQYLIYEPFNYEPLREANRLVFGRPEIPD